VVEDVLALGALTQRRRARRLGCEGGALTIHRTKPSFTFGPGGDVAGVRGYETGSANQLIEELMLMANVLTARALHARLPLGHAVLRRHPAPSPADLESLAAKAAGAGLELDVASAAALQRSLAAAAGGGGEEVAVAAAAMLMQPMKTAEYCLNGGGNTHHYALNVPFYTHFTSPIRRYADVLVHRSLALLLAHPSPAGEVPASALPPLAELAECVRSCNEKKLAAKGAQEASQNAYLASYLEAHPTDAPAVVFGVGAKSMSVAVPGMGLDARLFVDDMPRVTCAFNDAAQELTLRTAAAGSGAAQDAGGKRRRGVPDTCRFDELRLTLLSRVVVHLSARRDPLLRVCVSLVGGRE